MYLHTIAPAAGSKKKATRVGRGVGTGIGKTCGKGHKGQKARAGGYHKVGFEGGQMPIQRRLPKFGFTSLIGLVTAEVRLCDLEKVQSEVITLDALREANLIRFDMKRAKVMLKGAITKPVVLKGKNIRVTANARAAIEAAGGRVEE